VIHAVIVPLPVAARTTFETRVRQMPPPLVSTSIGPETYITRTPPPPVSAWTEPCTITAKVDLPRPCARRGQIRFPVIVHGSVMRRRAAAASA